MKTKISLMILSLSFFAIASPRPDVTTLQKELKLLNEYLEEGRDSLQDVIGERWTKKQRYVNQREVDKTKIAELREDQSSVMSTFSQIKEECYSLENRISDEKSTLQKRKEEWEYLTLSLSELHEKEAKRIDEIMPLDLENNRSALSQLTRNFAATRDPKIAVKEALEYYGNKIDLGSRISMSSEVVLPDDGEATLMNLVRFGNIFAYGLSTDGTPYTIRQTGKLGVGRYAIEEVGSEKLAATIQEALPRWVSSKSVTDKVPFDVMQNRNSSVLLSGKKVSKSTKLQMWFADGGPIMFPMLGLLIWAFILMILKLVQYSRKDKGYDRISHKILKFLKENKKKDALTYAKRKNGVVSKVVVTCLEHADWNRSGAEKAVKEILLDEIPKLNKSLATLSVIAGAAPLLGLLGTVTGMISLFAMITHYGTGDPKILAGGISEALVTTQAGLGVAIPILLVHNYLRSRSIHMQAEMHKHAFRILNRLWPLEK